ncbi:hypothetical protein ACFLTX_03040 [Chloroflexota bacterium]
MKKYYKIGLILAVIGVLAGLLLAFQIASIYQTTMDGKIAGERPDEAITVQIVFAILGWFSLVGASLMGVAVYGFGRKMEWAWFIGTAAATIFMLSAFFPIIPPASVGLPSPTMPTFVLAALLWFGMLVVGGVDRKIIVLCFFIGIAYVLSFMDGVAGISRYQTVPEALPHGIYAVTQMVNWWGGIAWAVSLLGILKRKTWIMPVSVFAALMSIFGGYALGGLEFYLGHGFSMFLPAPILSTVLLIYMLLPRSQVMLDKWLSGEEL